MNKILRILVALVPVTLSLALCLILIAQTESADSFDTPLKTTVLDFGPPPDFLGGDDPIKVSCYFYPTFVVKEYDAGSIASQWHEIIPVKKGAIPACTRKDGTGKMIVDSAGGYFRGVKGNLIFINAYDGFDGEFGFSVHDAATGRKIFEDAIHEPFTSEEKLALSPFDRFRFAATQDGRLYLRYLRIAGAGCDLHFERAPCWEKARKILGLASAQMPACGGNDDASYRVPSVIAYPVEVNLFPHPTIKPIDGPVRCWPED